MIGRRREEEVGKARWVSSESSRFLVLSYLRKYRSRLFLNAMTREDVFDLPYQLRKGLVVEMFLCSIWTLTRRITLILCGIISRIYAPG